MLADRITELSFKALPEFFRETVQVAQDMLPSIEKFIFDEKTSHLALEIVREAAQKHTLDALVDQVIFPFDDSWMEYITMEGKEGMFVAHSDDTVLVVTFSVGADGVSITVPQIFSEDLKSTIPSQLDQYLQEDDVTAQADLVRLVGLLAVLNAPKITQHSKSDLSKLNRARHKKKQLPLYEHKIVTIRKEARDAVYTRAGESNGKRLHHVRAFVRLKNGRLELVRHHWRGNPKLGVISHDYRL